MSALGLDPRAPAPARAPRRPRSTRTPARAVAVRGVLRHPELSLFAIAYLVYVGARWVFVGDLATAQHNAGRIIDLERWSGIDVEGNVQSSLSSGVVSWLLSNIYLAAQMAVVPAALIWLVRRSRPVYRRLRNTVVATWMLAIPVFALFPVAPPRLAGIGLADTVSSNGAVALTGRSTLFYNPYAAVPSLHVGFAFAIGIAVAAAVRHPVLKALALAWGPLVTLAVVATGNHYLFDVVAGLGITALGALVGTLVARRLAASERLGRARRLALADGAPA